MLARAVVFVGPRWVEVRELAVPAVPPPGGAILAVLANGICGSDRDVYVGATDPALTPFPMVAGHEIVGRIHSIDSEAERTWGLAVGDRIAVESSVPCHACADCRMGRTKFCRRPFTYSLTPLDVDPGLWGGMAEYMVLVPGTSFNRVPDHVSDQDAGLCNAFGNAFEWVCQGGEVGVGERVLVLGAGQRGLACAAVAREAGAAQVIVTGLHRDAHKLALAPAFGASDVIDVSHEDTVERVRDLTGGEGIDTVIDTVPGNTGTILDAIEVLRPGGTLVLAGVKGREISGLVTDRIFLKCLRVHGALGTRPWSSANAMRIIAEGRHPFHALHTHTVGLDGVERAIQLLGGEVEDTPVIHITVVP